MNMCPRIPLASLNWFACEPIGKADQTGGGQAGGLLFAFVLATALRACSSVPCAST